TNSTNWRRVISGNAVSSIGRPLGSQTSPKQGETIDDRCASDMSGNSGANFRSRLFEGKYLSGIQGDVFRPIDLTLSASLRTARRASFNTRRSRGAPTE